MKIWGHRGASAHAVENTLAAFRRARADGADGVELDARLSADGEVVVFHDDDLRRLAGRPDRVDRLTPSRRISSGDVGGGQARAPRPAVPVRAVKDHIAKFGKPPRAYAYDRGGWSDANVKELKRLHR